MPPKCSQCNRQIYICSTCNRSMPHGMIDSLLTFFMRRVPHPQQKSGLTKLHIVAIKECRKCRGSSPGSTCSRERPDTNTHCVRTTTARMVEFVLHSDPTSVVYVRISETAAAWFAFCYWAKGIEYVMFRALISPLTPSPIQVVPTKALLNSVKYEEPIPGPLLVPQSLADIPTSSTQPSEMVMEAAEEADEKTLLDMLCEIAQHLREAPPKRVRDPLPECSQEAPQPECPPPKRTRKAPQPECPPPKRMQEAPEPECPPSKRRRKSARPE
jgi:hypothetical protein